MVASKETKNERKSAHNKIESLDLDFSIVVSPFFVFVSVLFSYAL
jgi:hypothetical protein